MPANENPNEWFVIHRAKPRMFLVKTKNPDLARVAVEDFLNGVKPPVPVIEDRGFADAPDYQVYTAGEYFGEDFQEAIEELKGGK